MGIPILILGESGSGKSSSLRNFTPEEIGIFNVAGKPLPFRQQLPKMDGAKYADIIEALKDPTRKTYVIDDSQYLLSFEFFERSAETGYQKFTDLAFHFWRLIQFIIKSTPPDCLVYFLHHTDITDDGRIKAKTIGKMLDEKLTVEGLFSVVLLCKNDNGRYCFQTQSEGQSTAKSPLGMFEKEIENDLKLVDAAIRAYWGLNHD